MIILLIIGLFLANIFIIILSYKKLRILKIGVEYSSINDEKIVDSSIAVFLAFIWPITWTVSWMAQVAETIVSAKDKNEHRKDI